MKKKHLYFILILLLFISIGFAILSSTLNIGGKVGYSASKWDVYFDNIDINEDSISANTISIEDKTTVRFNCTFEQPGEFFEFNIDVINAGTMDVMLNEIIKNNLETNQAKFLSYEIKYLGGQELKQYDLLPSKNSTKVNIKVSYNYDIDEVPNLSDISLAISLNYILADDNATKLNDNNIWNFDYTGSEEVFTAPYTGRYLLETWGASGGKVEGCQEIGYGGYSKGVIELVENQELYINVGEAGISMPIAYTTNVVATRNSYNGGGSGTTNNNTIWAGGGGATHISTVSGLLSTLEDKKDSIIIVSGAGGGSTYFYGYKRTGGSGGGYLGAYQQPASFRCGDAGTAYDGGGATQTSGGVYYNNEAIKNGKFGLGGNSGAGGGSGFYGGAASYSCGAAGGGGSGYIGNPLLSNKLMTCFDCDESNDINTKTIATTKTSEMPISQYAKIGNGYVRITYMV